MAENPPRRSPLVALGLVAWAAAAFAYLAAGALTWGKPTEAFLASAAGQWRYVLAPAILTLLALSLLLAGGVSFIMAARRGRNVPAPPK